MPTDRLTEAAGKSGDAAVVLVADDDVVHRLLMRESLEVSGFIVHEAGDGLEALDLLDRLHPELMFLDAMMPRVDGFAACVETRKRPHGAHVPVLMVTGLDDVSSIDRAYQAGATDFITKPINWPLFNHRARFLLRFGRTHRRIRRRRGNVLGTVRTVRGVHGLVRRLLRLVGVLVDGGVAAGRGRCGITRGLGILARDLGLVGGVLRCGLGLLLRFRRCGLRPLCRCRSGDSQRRHQRGGQ